MPHYAHFDDIIYYCLHTRARRRYGYAIMIISRHAAIHAAAALLLSPFTASPCDYYFSLIIFRHYIFIFASLMLPLRAVDYAADFYALIYMPLLLMPRLLRHADIAAIDAFARFSPLMLMRRAAAEIMPPSPMPPHFDARYARYATPRVTPLRHYYAAITPLLLPVATESFFMMFR